MAKQETVGALDRTLHQKDFENAQCAINGGKETGALQYPQIAEALIGIFKKEGTTVQAPIEAITLCAIFLDAKELLAVRECLNDIIKKKIVEKIPKEKKLEIIRAMIEAITK